MSICLSRSSRTTATLLAAAAAMSCVIASSGHAAVSGVEMSDRTGDFTEFVREFEPKWVGTASVIRDRGKRTTVRPPRLPDSPAGDGGFDLVISDIVVPGQGIPGSGGFGGSSAGAASVSYGAATFVSFLQRPGTSRSEFHAPFSVTTDASEIDAYNAARSPSHAVSGQPADARIRAAAVATLEGKRAVNTFDPGWGQEVGPRFTEVLLDQKHKGKRRTTILANGSNFAETTGFGANMGRASASAVAGRKAKARASATSQTEHVNSVAVARTQMVEFDGYLNLRGDAKVTIEIVNTDTGEAVFGWESKDLPAGRHDIELVTALDGIDASNTGGLDSASVYEVRVNATAHASAKSKLGKKTRTSTSAVEYRLPAKFWTPANYKPAEWTYRAPRWTDVHGNENVADSYRIGGDDRVRSVRDGLIHHTGIQPGLPPDPIDARVPFDLPTLGADDYRGSLALNDALLATLPTDLAQATLTPAINSDGYWLTFGDHVTASVSREDGYRSGRVLELGEALIDALVGTGYDRADVEAMFEYTAVGSGFQLRDTGLTNASVSLVPDASWIRDPHTEPFLSLVEPVDGEIIFAPEPIGLRPDDDYGIFITEVLGDFWQPLVTDYTPGYWEKTADEFIPSAEEAMAAYLADLEADGVAFDPILGPVASSSPLVLSSPAAAVPEPGTLAAMASLGLVALGRRRGARR